MKLVCGKQSVELPYDLVDAIVVEDLLDTLKSCKQEVRRL